MRNRYLYVGEFAYWFTWPRGRVPMLNREHVSVQERDRTGWCSASRWASVSGIWTAAPFEVPPR